MQAASVAKFISDTAAEFKVAAVVLLQPNDRYYSDGHNGPRVDHIDRGKQWVKNAHAVGFMHKPHRFDDEKDASLVEFWWLESRKSATAHQSLKFEPLSSKFSLWEGQLPASSAVNEVREKVLDESLFEDGGALDEIEF